MTGTPEIEALRREVERLRALASTEQGLLDAVLNNSPHGIIVCDAQGQLTLQNRASERIWAGSATTPGVEGWGQYRAFHPDGRPFEPTDWSMYRCLSRKETIEAEEVHFQRFDGSHGVLLGSCAPILESDGALKGAVSIFADITRVKQVEDALRERVEFEQQLIGIVSHDLRNPLNAVLTAAQLLLQRGGLDSAQTSSVRRIVSAGDRATRMIRDLLDFTQARSGRLIPIEAAPVDLHEVARQAVEEMKLSHPEREIESVHSGDANGSWDQDRVTQILDNLLSNAIRYGSVGSPVRVDVRGAPEDVVVEVLNLGNPIPEVRWPDLFQPLNRAGAKLDNTTRSIGLGLYIVRQIALAHGGSVAVRSSAAEGTTFRVTLPRRLER